MEEATTAGAATGSGAQSSSPAAAGLYPAFPVVYSFGPLQYPGCKSPLH